MRPSVLVVAALLLPGHASGANTRIPLVDGLVEVSTTQSPDGDKEFVLAVTRADSGLVGFAVIFREPGANGPVTDTRTREVRREDLANSHRRNGYFQVGDPLKFPGSTLNQVSTSTLAELNATGRSPFVEGLPGSVGDVAAASRFKVSASGRKYFRGSLVRVEPGVVPISVVVNGTPTRLDTVHVKAALSVGDDRVVYEMWVMDDPLNPMILRVRHRNSLSQTIRFDFPVEVPLAARLQLALAGGPGSIGWAGSGNRAGTHGIGAACHANLSGIYFDFAQATLLPQSAGTLRAVADVMASNPDWSLRIEGHTDNVGGDAFNMALSHRRAAAVRDALVAQFKVPAARLAATGFGATRPVASNDSLDGRASNRRVELARTCP